MQAKLTILCENSVGVPFDVIGEHGFACYVETEAGHYLFDTGQGYAIIQNSLTLEKDLRAIKSIMISHGHYDHTGGLPAVLKMRGSVDVYGHTGIFAERIWEKDEVIRSVGIPYRRSYLESLGARFRLGTEMIEVGPGVYLTGEIPRKSDFETGDTSMTLVDGGKGTHPDPISDDLSMIIDSDKGLVVVLGCAHAGMINILDYTIEKFGREKIYAVIGGTHLGFSSDDQFDETLKVIDRYDIERVGVSHCTGLVKASLLHAKLGERFFFGSVGSVLDL